MTDPWVPDVLGPDFQALTLPLADDDEGEVVATLVRHRPAAPGPTPPDAAPTPPVRAVLYLHGWNDYFFQVPTARFWHGLGVAFYALDLRKYGRSLRDGQSPGYIEDLAEYDTEIGLALDRIRADLGPHTRIMLHAHSTGGLVAVLWAARHPGVTRGLILNSPWLELAGATFARALAGPLSTGLARTQPKVALPNIDPGHNARGVLKRLGGEWEYDEDWRPTPMFPIRPGWAQAVLTGHAEVARGLDLREPVLTLISTRSLIVPRWRDEMTEVDSVLDVEQIARRTSHLGRVSTLVRIPGGQHDLSLSALPARTRYYEEIARWLASYGWSGTD